MPDNEYVYAGPRKMPAKNRIKDHWQMYLVESGKFEDRDEMNDGDVCFACKMNTCGTHKAHIVPRMYGGSDHVDNIVLLCRHCHKETEYFFDILQDADKTREMVFRFIQQRTVADVLEKYAALGRFFLENGMFEHINARRALNS